MQFLFHIQVPPKKNTDVAVKELPSRGAKIAAKQSITQMADFALMSKKKGVEYRPAGIKKRAASIERSKSISSNWHFLPSFFIYF